MKNDIFDDFGVISKLMKNDSFLYFINHFLSKSAFFNDILSLYSIIESIKCNEEENDEFSSFIGQNMIFIDDFYIKMKDLMQNVKYQDFEIHGHLEEFLIKLGKNRRFFG